MALHYDTESIYGAARAFTGGPLEHMRAAETYAKNDTELSWHALGVVGANAVSTYNSSLTEMRANLANGVDTVQKIADGLVTVARNYSDADKYSTISPPPGADIPYTKIAENKPNYTANEGIINLAALPPLTTPLYWEKTPLYMQASYVAIRKWLLVDTALEKTCLGAFALWALFSPSDSEVDKAIESWIQIENQLEAVDNDILDILKLDLPSSKWSNNESKGDNARRSFDRFMSNSFLAELRECKNRAATTHASLMSLKEEVNQVQGVFFAYVCLCSLALYAAWIASFWPPAMSTAIAMKKFCASLLGISTAGALAAIAAMTGAKSASILNLWIGTENKFPSNKINKDGRSTNFNDVNRMDWHWGDPAQVK